jgi:RNA polymerase sigma-70 factor, ECF subfamily
MTPVVTATRPSDMESTADAELMDRLGLRDQRALVELYRRYARKVYPLVLRIVCDETLAEEVLQDVFVRLWTRPERYRPDAGPLIAWLLTVARNLALDARRRETRWRRDLDFDDQLYDGVASDAESEPLAAEVRAAVTLLPENQRQAIELAYFSGMTHAEMATHLEEPLGTVKSRLRLALHKLRDALRRDAPVNTR